jgi:hypothetical protein
VNPFALLADDGNTDPDNPSQQVENLAPKPTEDEISASRKRKLASDIKKAKAEESLTQSTIAANRIAKEAALAEISPNEIVEIDDDEDNPVSLFPTNIRDRDGLEHLIARGLDPHLSEAISFMKAYQNDLWGAYNGIVEREGATEHVLRKFQKRIFTITLHGSAEDTARLMILEKQSDLIDDEITSLVAAKFQLDDALAGIEKLLKMASQYKTRLIAAKASRAQRPAGKGLAL